MSPRASVPFADLFTNLTIDPRPLSVGRDFEVYRGTYGGRPVAIKVARGDSDTPAREALLEAEAAALARLTGSGVVPELIGMTRLPGGRLALVRGWVEGLSLATLIERALVRRRWQGGRRWNAPTRALVARLCDAVERVHAAGLVHNDLKPDDIIITRASNNTVSGSDLEVVLLDLGLAARPKHGGPGGTVAYASPERLEGDAGTVKSDLWALGAVVFELLAGTRAYPADQPVDARLERRHPIQRSPREAAALAWRQLPSELQVALAAALDADPRHRPKNVAAFVRTLKLARHDTSGSALPNRDAAPNHASRATSTVAPKRRWRDPVLLAATLATVTAAVVAWGPMSRALGFDRSGSNTSAACEAVQRRAEALCRGLSGEAACRAALTATDDCAARADLLGACEAP